MKGTSPCFLEKIGFSRWENSSSLWKYKCICGRIVDIDIRRLRKGKRRTYRSCGCLRESNSKTYFYAYRRKFFERIYKDKDHWIYKTTSKQEIVKCSFRKKHYSIQRLAYMFWNHILKIPNGYEVSATCKKRDCVSPSHLRLLTISESVKIKRLNSEHWNKPWSKKRNKDAINNTI